jgi:hypothetical protein
MSLSRSWSLALTCFIALLLFLVVPGLAQEGEEAVPPSPSDSPGESSVIDYLRGSYRDPFRSLREPKLKDDEVRPAGPPGMLIEEIDVVGVLSGPRGAMVLILGSDGLGYSLTEGAPLYDGVTLKINPDAGLVIFRQDVNDPNRIKPYRDIERRLDSGS